MSSLRADQRPCEQEEMIDYDYMDYDESFADSDESPPPPPRAGRTPHKHTLYTPLYTIIHLQFFN